MIRDSWPPVMPIEPLRAPPDAEVELPGSKSITNRALLCAALATGATELTGVLFADDTEAMLDVLGTLGVEIERHVESSSVTVHGSDGLPLMTDEAVLDARMSGTTSRFIIPVVATADRQFVVDGDPQLRTRPFDDLVFGLTQLGATVTARDGSAPKSLPLLIEGPLTGSEASIRTTRSSQFLSGLMLAGPLTKLGLTLFLDEEVVSRPYITMTKAVMETFGAEVTVRRDRVRVEPGGYQSPGSFLVEPDASAASYFFAAAAVSGGSVTVAGLSESSLQGDVRFVRVLEQMGAEVELGDDRISVRGGRLRGTEANLSDLSDIVPTLAIVAAMADGPTHISGVAFIRGKESDRIAATVAELNRCGVEAREDGDGLTILPSGPPRGAQVQTYDDHRMAMAFSVLGLVVPGITIENPQCVEKTFPDFFATLDLLR